MKPTLVIGTYNYSSWSLRPWLALRTAGIDFDIVRIPLYQPDTKARILERSPAGTVPVLQHGELVLWESLAICEYAAELAPREARLWPEDLPVRARARSVATEMHGGFPAVRQTLPMNFRGRAKRTPELPADARAQIARIEASWSDCLARASGGPFLFGRFSVADAMYAPVVSRFRTYRVPLGPAASAYVDAVWALPAMQEWGAEAARESERMDAVEALLA